MRLNKDILVQPLPDEQHIVIIDQSTGQEIVISEEIALRLLPALQYFFPALFVDISPYVAKEPPSEALEVPA